MMFLSYNDNTMYATIEVRTAELVMVELLSITD
jgi:hypothetical protein